MVRKLKQRPYSESLTIWWNLPNQNISKRCTDNQGWKASVMGMQKNHISPQLVIQYSMFGYSKNKVKPQTLSKTGNQLLCKSSTYLTFLGSIFYIIKPWHSTQYNMKILHHLYIFKFQNHLDQVQSYNEQSKVNTKIANAQM